MSETAKTDYVLGTNADELVRLGKQHQVWQPITRASWQRAGIKPGSHVLDVGAGPGYAALDLAELVGPGGRVTALERSENFTEHLRRTAAARQMTNISVEKLDLVLDPLPALSVDFAWCRWVCIFLTDPDALIAKLKTVLKPGGKVIFFEYLTYESWRMIPAEPMLGEFVARIMSSWKAVNGNANVSPVVINSLKNHGFKLDFVTPHLFAARPADPFFSWLTDFMRVNTARSLDLGEITPEWATKFLHVVASAEVDPNCVMMTPTVLEIIATRT